MSTYIPEKLRLKDPQFIALGDTKTAEQAVEEISKRGGDLIKIWFLQRGFSKANLESMRAAIVKAHSKNIRVAAHATELALARLAVDAGVDILVHSVTDELLDSNFLELLKKNKIIYIPTLQVKKGYRDVLQKTHELIPIEKACGDPHVISTWAELRAPQDDSDDEDDGIAQENLRRVAKAGITIAAGSDAGNIGTLHGPGLHRELELMVQAGLSPFAALLSATRNAALVISPEPQVGTLEVGKKADLLILNQDPLKDIRNLSKIETVIKDGKISNSTPSLPL